jgi:starch synthase (maltosyl-transferring)
MIHLQQSPSPGSHHILHAGDRIEFTLQGVQPLQGAAWLRTNVGNAAIRRQEINHHARRQKPFLDLDWHDIPMRRLNDRCFRITLPLTEVGFFQAKAFLLPDGTDLPLWPEGANTAIKVEPAEWVASCTMYTAFVRQFGTNANRTPIPDSESQAAKQLEAAGYTVIPKSGTFRDLIKKLDFIIGTLRFRIVQLLPIHPAPTTYARMGQFGSPFAVQDFMDVDPSLAEFDRHTTPMEQFRELADAVHQREGRLFIDIPINHTGWASWLQIHYPQWFVRNEDRSFQSPGAWGVTWEDLSKLDYQQHPLWFYMADVFIYWCRQGVDGFRCDAGYMIPLPVWQYITAKVRDQYPDTVFMLEGLGGSLETTHHLLQSANLDWAYSELFQTHGKNALEAYLPHAIHVSDTQGLLIHFAETHDNLRLAATSADFARFRLSLCALCAQNGAFGITNGVEWLATEKISVHGASSLNWGAPGNLISHISRLNAILEAHPCFFHQAKVRLIYSDKNHNTLVIHRSHASREIPLLVVINCDGAQPGEATWPLIEFQPQGPVYDLVSGKKISVNVRGSDATCTLEPYGVYALTASVTDLDQLDATLTHAFHRPPPVIRQGLQAKILAVLADLKPGTDFAALDMETAIEQLTTDPLAYLKTLVQPASPPLTQWQWPRDLKRKVMIPPGDWLLIRSDHPAIGTVLNDGQTRFHEWSLPLKSGGYFILVPPAPVPKAATETILDMAVFSATGCRHEQGALLYLPRIEDARARLNYDASEVTERQLYALCANGRGAMSQVRGHWSDIHSQYDALLAGNLHPQHPTDRHVMFTRCRGWIVHRGYSTTLDHTCLTRFAKGVDGGAVWHFSIPCGMGQTIPFTIGLRLFTGENRIQLTFTRQPADGLAHVLHDAEPVMLILRPDIEDRSCHEITRAYLGPETMWPRAIQPHADGFTFTPHATRPLHLRMAHSAFVQQPEWNYLQPHPFDMARGVNGHSDLFSPGYFTINMNGSQTAALDAAIGANLPAPALPQPDAELRKKTEPIRDTLKDAMRDYIVKRDDSLTIIAGYPWFLDWGRDTLICLRGLIAAGMLEPARDILSQFARFEERGTIPNMIRGHELSNRDTSDAPLWFFIACADYMRATRSDDLLAMDCGGRPLRHVLLSIGTHYRQGTPNGIRMDPSSGLVFSPSHFTWMDTNHPAGTPRQGYPIEIQALWHAALQLLARIDPAGQWAELEHLVQDAIIRHYLRPEGFLADCLHATAGTPAAQAAADDALRPNQLFAITLGAITRRDIAEKILTHTEELIIPGGMRTLADRPVEHPLPIQNNGNMLNDPNHPYWGHYEGDEDTRRKPAYHNGTAWAWLLPIYAESLIKTYGDHAKPRAQAILGSCSEILNVQCIGQLNEIIDGSMPHTLRGCGAQAWSITEFYRVLSL